MTSGETTPEKIKDSSGVHVWLVMMKAYQALQRHAERSIEKTGLGFSDFITLEVLLHKGPQHVCMLSERLCLTSGAMTATVDRLEKKGLVERQFHPEDRRVRIVSLTPSGRELIEDIFGRHRADMEVAFSGLDVSQREVLIELLKLAGKEAANCLESPS